MRFVAPALFFAAAMYVRHYNSTHRQEKLLVPGLDLIPALQGDVIAQSEWSWVVLAAIGAILLVLSVFSAVRDAKAAEEPKF